MKVQSSTVAPLRWAMVPVPSRSRGEKPDQSYVVFQEIAEDNWSFSGLLTDDWTRQREAVGG